jgi:hypothetical protein
MHNQNSNKFNKNLKKSPLFRLDELVLIHDKERGSLLKNSNRQRKGMDAHQDFEEHFLDDVVIALDQRHASLEAEIKTDYQAVKEDVRNRVIFGKQIWN